MTRRIVDLSQPLSARLQVHPFFPPVQIYRHMRHVDVPEGRHSIDVEVLVLANHVGTHVDAIAHFDRRPEAPKIAEMPLETFCGPALCVDVRDYPAGHAVTPSELERELDRGGLEVRERDIVLFCTDHYNRTAGTPEFLAGFSGLHADTVHWMADRGVKIFGVEPLSPDLVYKNSSRAITDFADGAMPVHDACLERGLTHYEGLNNLAEVVGRRFEFYGLPLRLEPAAGSPVRAIAVLDGEA